jgi:hypothetical protein
VSLETAEQSTVIRARRGRLAQDNDIQTWQLALVVPERFSDDSFQPVSTRRQPAILLADRKSQSRLVCAVRPVENGKHFIAAAVGLLKNAAKGGFVCEPASTSEAAVHVCVRCFVFSVVSAAASCHALWRQPRPTFGATPLYYETAGFRCHPRSESMRASPL